MMYIIPLKWRMRNSSEPGAAASQRRAIWQRCGCWSGWKLNWYGFGARWMLLGPKSISIGTSGIVPGTSIMRNNESIVW